MAVSQRIVMPVPVTKSSDGSNCHWVVMAVTVTMSSDGSNCHNE